MKQITSIWMLAARRVVWKLLAVLLVLAAVQTGLFCRALKQTPETYEVISFGYYLQNAGISRMFHLGIAAATGILCYQGTQFSKGQMGYTLRRLAVEEKWITALWGLVNLACYVIFWALELVIMLLFWRLYCAETVVASPGLELYVEFYRTRFLHNLLPIANLALWLRNLLWVLCLSAYSAFFGYWQRRGKIRIMPVLLVAYGVIGFSGSMNDTASNSISILFLAVLLVWLPLRLWRRFCEGFFEAEP